MTLEHIILDALSRPSPSPRPSPTNPDLSSTASSYSSFAGILAGFSFTALAIFLGWHPESKRCMPRTNRHIQRTKVAAALFYAMVSLVMCSFLYASATTHASNAEQRVPAELLIYGIIFGVSVLTLFYSLTLMMYENSRTMDAAGYAYWAVVIAGPIVVLRFLTEAANSVWRTKCAPECPSELLPQPMTVGIISLAILLLFSVVITVFRLLSWWKPGRGILNALYPHPTFPAVVVFILATCTAVGSLLITEPDGFTLPSSFASVSLIVGAVILMFFALACGCVIGPRVDIGLPDWLKKVLRERAWAFVKQRASRWNPDPVQPSEPAQKPQKPATETAAGPSAIGFRSGRHRHARRRLHPPEGEKS
jgi:hypothetical protein